LKSALIFGTILLGILLPIGHHLTFLIRYFLMVMLFFAFLEVKIEKAIVTPAHLKVVLLNVLIPLVVFYLIQPFNLMIALAGFVICSAPTAAGAPVIAVLMKKKVSYVTASVILTSPVMALVIPFTLPLVLHVHGEVNAWEVLLPVAQVVFIPLLLAQLIRNFWSGAKTWLEPFQKLPYYLFLANVYIASAKATDYVLHDEQTAWYEFLWIALTIGFICLMQFKIGEWVGAKETAIESGLALGRKNTMFALWIALTFINPVAGLGPIFYIVFHNVYNSWQMYKYR
jgi:BASS family bile acid:Na+ symporter